MRSIAKAALGAAMIVAALPFSAAAASFVVDDDNIECPSAPYRTINEALVFAGDGDDINVCPGLYEEQVVLTRRLRLRGLPAGSNRPVVKPAALAESRTALFGSQGPIAAGIIVDVDQVKIEGLDLDLTETDLIGCAPVSAGIYMQNASGSIEDVRVSGPAGGGSQCESGIGLLIEGGEEGEIVGEPLFGRAIVSVSNSEFSGYQKAGIVALGEETLLKARNVALEGPGTVGGSAPNGVDIGLLAKARISDITITGHRSSGDKMGAGLLATSAKRVKFRDVTVLDADTGAFIVGDRQKVLSSRFGDIRFDGIVLLGERNKVKGNSIENSSVSGVFIDGDDNMIRSTIMARLPNVGIWFFKGDRNKAAGIQFIDLGPGAEAERVGGVRTPAITESSVDPFVP